MDRSNFRRTANVCVAALVGLLAACSSDQPTPSTTLQADATTTAAPADTASPNGPTRPEISADGEILFRETVAGFVTNTVRAYGPEVGLDEYAIQDAVDITYPSVGVTNGVTEADPKWVSFLGSYVVSEKDLPSADNAYLAAVAVMDTTGACLGVVIYGYPTLDDTFTVDNVETCTAQAVTDTFLAQL